MTQQIAAPLLTWFYASKRALPFRTLSTPYRVWVSEIMLQQTRVSAALPYFERFMQELPTVADLAACPPEKLTKLWEGLGYYNRVRNLQKAARIVMEQYGGALPASFAALRALPGIGDYTAGAIASISFGLPEIAVDGNVLRVFARLFADDGDILLPETKKRLSALVRAAQPAKQPGPFNEALMELGALVCVPNGAPLCEQCPLRALCLAHKSDLTETLPVKAAAKARRKAQYTAVLAVLPGEPAQVLLHHRAEGGLLGGLWEPLMLDGWQNEDDTRCALAQLGLTSSHFAPLPAAKHIFTHLEWHMQGWACCCAAAAPPPGCVWATGEELKKCYTLPGAYKTYKKEAERLL